MLPEHVPARAPLRARLHTVRKRTEALCAPLHPEDFCLQSLPDASPAKWHLAHPTWFFEQFVLRELPGYRVFDESYSYLFNSYYQKVGKMHPRPQRGLLTRPVLDEVWKYRAYVDEALDTHFDRFDSEALTRIEIGTHHEEQHQELLLTDVKHGFAQNPLYPAYRRQAVEVDVREAPAHTWVEHPGGVARIGVTEDVFHFDNEGPSHRVFLEPFALGSRLITVGEYEDFIADGGYQRAELWLSDAWHLVQTEGWSRPLYWLDDGRHFTLDGVRARNPHAAVTHISYYEAEAYANWTGYRLAPEYDWEVIAKTLPVEGNFVDSQRLHPGVASAQEGLQQMFGDVWEWTKSAYASYPAFRAPPGAIGEYNGKFMCNQMVLRGGSCASPQDHVRATYRNFFPPWARWQFSGIRLARDL